MLGVGLISFVTSLFPRVDDPWPDAVGLELPIVTTGVGCVVASVLYARAPKAKRDEAIRYGGLNQVIFD
jgi:hypothetical protein